MDAKTNPASLGNGTVHGTVELSGFKRSRIGGPAFDNVISQSSRDIQDKAVAWRWPQIASAAQTAQNLLGYYFQRLGVETLDGIDPAVLLRDLSDLLEADQKTVSQEGADKITFNKFLYSVFGYLDLAGGTRGATQERWDAELATARYILGSGETYQASFAKLQEQHRYKAFKYDIAVSTIVRDLKKSGFARLDDVKNPRAEGLAIIERFTHEQQREKANALFISGVTGHIRDFFKLVFETDLPGSKPDAAKSGVNGTHVAGMNGTAPTESLVQEALAGDEGENPPSNYTERFKQVFRRAYLDKGLTREKALLTAFVAAKAVLGCETPELKAALVVGGIIERSGKLTPKGETFLELRPA